MFSRLQAPFPALALGPVAVLPDRQRMGVGSRLIREGIARSEAAGWTESSSSAIPPSIGVSDSMSARRAALSHLMPDRI